MKALVIFFSLLIAIFGVLIGVGYLKFVELIRPLPKPNLDPNRYWGRGDERAYKPDENIYAFKIETSEKQIQELHKQLNRTIQFTEPLEGVKFDYGFNSDALRQFVIYWREKYLSKWSEREAYLNSLPQYKTEIQGLRIHYIHAKPSEEVASKKRILPLLLLHGWPGSVREFYDFIPILTQEQNITNIAFEVVAPSLVGYGFSDATSKPGFNAAQMAIVMRNLMLRLGHQQFLIQGGDWGSVIGSDLATLFPENVIGYHSNMCVMHSFLSFIKGIYANYYPDNYIPNRFFYEHHFPIWNKMAFLLKESGYFHIQATKPDTIGAVLNANPIGLAAYILEKFQTATGPDLNQELGAIATAYTLEAVLDNIMIYYLTNTSTTAARFYAENVKLEYLSLNLDRVQTPVPMGCSRFKHDLPSATDWQLRDKFPNLLNSKYFQQNGHFAALEVPGLLYSDFIEFVDKIKLTD